MEDDILKIYGVNDFPEEQSVTLQVRALTFEGKVLSDVVQPDTKINPDSSRMIWQATSKTLLDKQKPENCVVEIQLKSPEGKILYRRLYYMVPPKKLTLPKANINLQVEQVTEGYKLTLSSERLAKNVFIGTEADGFFNDNYFDLLPGEKKTVIFKTERILDDMKNSFTTKSLVDAWE
jgi:beta-mannosidase